MLDDGMDCACIVDTSDAISRSPLVCERYYAGHKCLCIKAGAVSFAQGIRFASPFAISPMIVSIIHWSVADANSSLGVSFWLVDTVAKSFAVPRQAPRVITRRWFRIKTAYSKSRDPKMSASLCFSFCNSLSTPLCLEIF